MITDIVMFNPVWLTCSQVEKHLGLFRLGDTYWIPPYHSSLVSPSPSFIADRYTDAESWTWRDKGWVVFEEEHALSVHQQVRETKKSCSIHPHVWVKNNHTVCWQRWEGWGQRSHLLIIQLSEQTILPHGCTLLKPTNSGLEKVKTTSVLLWDALKPMTNK